jgi:hypothetical protein
MQQSRLKRYSASGDHEFASYSWYAACLLSTCLMGKETELIA